MSRSQSAKNTSLEEILMSSINESKCGGDEGRIPESSKVELEVKI